jgi:hypothetical protein
VYGGANEVGGVGSLAEPWLGWDCEPDQGNMLVGLLHEIFCVRPPSRDSERSRSTTLDTGPASVHMRSHSRTEDASRSRVASIPRFTGENSSAAIAPQVWPCALEARPGVLVPLAASAAASRGVNVSSGVGSLRASHIVTLLSTMAASWCESLGLVAKAWIRPASCCATGIFGFLRSKSRRKRCDKPAASMLVECGSQVRVLTTSVAAWVCNIRLSLRAPRVSDRGSGINPLDAERMGGREFGIRAGEGGGATMCDAVLPEVVGTDRTGADD